MTAGRLSALWLTAALAAGGAAQTPRLERLEVVSSIWLQARQHYVHWDRVTADWDSAYRATVEASERGGSDIAFHDHLARFTAVLGSGDVRIIPPPAVQRRMGRPPIRLGLVDGRPIVVQVQPTAETRIAGVIRGDEVTQVRVTPVDRWLRDSVVPAIGASSQVARDAQAVEEMLTGERNTALPITLRGPDGTPRGASLTRSVAAENRIVPAELRDGIAERDTAGVRIVALGELDRDRIVRALSQALTRSPAPTGVVLDLRDAIGGDRALALRLTALFFAAPVEAPRIKHRIYWPVRAVEDTGEAWTWHLTSADTVTPAEDAYGGPLVLLTSPRTAGAAEFFSGMAQVARRAAIVGERTAGAAGVTATLELPGGWLLVVPVGSYVAPDATELANAGIDPDYRVRESVNDLRSGRDPTLARALELLATGELPRP